MQQWGCFGTAMFRLRDLVTNRSKREDGGAPDADDATILNDRAAQVARQIRTSPPVAERTLETRAQARFVPQRTVTSFTLKTGKRHSARIMNMSRYGVALEADFSKIAVEDIALVGQRAVTYIRNFRRGAVFRFKTALEEKLCNPTIIL
jgi:hypothetical protein